MTEEEAKQPAAEQLENSLRSRIYEGPWHIPIPELARYFESKFPDLKCVLCTYSGFDIAGTKDDYGSVRLYSYIDDNNRHKAEAIFTFTCKNCGHLYRFSSAHILDWLNKNPRSDET